MKTFIKKTFNLFSIALFLFAFSACEKDDVKPRDPGNGGGGGTVDNTYVLKGSINKKTILTNHRSGWDYEVQGSLTIYDELIIEEGVELRMASNARITVKGEGLINAVGTADHPITIKGNASSSGYWYTIIVESNNPDNVFDYVSISDGGGESYYSNTSVYIGGSGQLTIKNSSISNSKGYGLYTDGSIPNFSNNTFSKNGDAPVRINFSRISDLDASSNYADNNYNNYIHVAAANLNQNQEVQSLNVPYFINGNCYIDGDLTLKPGVDFLMASTARIIVRANGSFNAVGTNTEPITIKGKAASVGYWDDIIFESNHPNNEFKHVTIENSGKYDYYYNSTIYVSENASLKINDCTIKDSYGWGIYVRNGANMDPSTKVDLENANSFSNNATGSGFNCSDSPCNVYMN